ncbi:uncharacterized protein LOC128388249 [Panonychus citri]|uniref:uncharacterized protein LOC128388249 n=1 Tax=Panonychus citri TaxID=50023 RepID=UPI002307927B|nr:uncharacterized protein LOC128388249 [Panonychus citri]
MTSKGIKLTFTYVGPLIVLTVLILITNFPEVNGHLHLGFGHRRKIELAKKIGLALFIAAKNKKLMFPLPLPLPLPIPIFKTYQPVIHDPLFFKHQSIKQHLGNHLAGATGFG